MIDARSMIVNLQELYGEYRRTVRYEISKQLFKAKMTEGTDVGDHVLKMINLIGQLEVLNFYMDVELQIDLVLQSLLDSFAPFILNFNMNKLECLLPELLNMLTTAQAQIKGKRQERVLAIASSSRSSKKKKSSSSKKKKLGLKRKFPKASTNRRDQVESVSTGRMMGIRRGTAWCISLA